MNRRVNPFKALGFDPSALYRLTDEQAQTLAEALYRAQMQIHHTDVGGSDERSAELNWARDEIRTNGAYWRKQFAKKRRDQLQELEEALAVAEDECAAVEDRFAGFWKSLIAPDEGVITIFRLPEMRILVADMVEEKIQHQLATKAGRATGISRGAGKTWEFRVSADGSLARCPVRTVEFDSRQQEPPRDLPEGWVANSGVPWNCLYWQPGTPKPFPGMRLIGTLDKDRLQWGDRDRYKLLGLLPAHDSDEASRVADNGFPLETFRPYLQYLQPGIDRSQLLVGVLESPKIKFFLLGRIMAIHR